MDDKLKDIFNNINDWLKYAEAKSITLIAGNGVYIFGLVRTIKTYDINGYMFVYVALCISLCLISLSICMISLIPSLSMPWESKTSGTDKSDNIIYFSHIAKYTPMAYLKKLSAHIGENTIEYNEFQKDMAKQIIINSVIAHRKFNYFNISIWLTLCAVISPVIALMIIFIRKK